MPPKTIGFIVNSKDSQRSDSLMLEECYIGPKYAKSLADGLVHARFISKVSLKNCGLVDSTLETILNACDYCSELDVSLNPKLKQGSVILIAQRPLTHLSIEGVPNITAILVAS